MAPTGIATDDVPPGAGAGGGGVCEGDVEDDEEPPQAIAAVMATDTTTMRNDNIRFSEHEVSEQWWFRTRDAAHSLQAKS